MASLLGEIGGRFLEEAIGFGVGTAISEPLRPFVEQLTQEAWRLHPVRELDPADLAAGVVQGVLGHDAAAAEAKGSGYDDERFGWLVKINGSPIAPEQALDLWNRGEIREGDVERALLQSRLKPEWVDTYKLLRRQILQLADLANMVVQGILPAADARGRAQQLGLGGDDFDLVVRLAGNPPGPQETLEMWQRGILTEDEATRALRQSRLKPEWIEQFKQLRLRPATIGQAVSAVVKERTSFEHGAQIALENGIDAETFRLLVDEAGRPMPTGQALTLVRRGQMTEQQFREVVARSDVKTDYVDELLKLRTVYPSLAQMRAIIGSGAMPDAEARDVLEKLGYTPAVIAGILAAGHGTKLAGTRELTQSAIVTSYKDRALEKTEAAGLLAGIGYDENDAALILGTADYEIAKSYRTSVVAIVKTRYLQHDIDDTTASSWLDRIGLPSGERDQLLELWRFDVEANPHLLTLAQLRAAYDSKIVSRDDFLAYLPRLGYVDPELTILAKLYAPG